MSGTLSSTEPCEGIPDAGTLCEAVGNQVRNWGPSGRQATRCLRELLLSGTFLNALHDPARNLIRATK